MNRPRLLTAGKPMQEALLWLSLLPGTAGAGITLSALGDWQEWVLVVTLNLLVLATQLMLGWRIIGPWQRTARLVRRTVASLSAEPSPRHGLVGEIARLASLAQESARRQQQLSLELAEARAALAQYRRQQEALLAHADREMMAQYQAVLTFAHRLEEHIAMRTAQPELRYDFDDVCESAFNLKLMAQALQVLREASIPAPAPVPLAGCLQGLLLSLAPSLDRRAMKLDSSGISLDAQAHCHAPLLSHALWMMLLGIVRYAQEESTLSVRCAEEDGHVAVGITISELAPGRLAPGERHAHLQRQMEQPTPHMFAETIRLHGNIRLAEMLLGRMGGEISVIPLDPYRCDIRLSLPAA